MDGAAFARIAVDISVCNDTLDVKPAIGLFKKIILRVLAHGVGVAQQKRNTPVVKAAVKGSETLLFCIVKDVTRIGSEICCSIQWAVRGVKINQ